jgi:pimeloyl-ACP methyl ester carboxylesterase
MTTSTIGFAIISTTADGAGAPTFLLIHGFLDDATVWDDVNAALAGRANTVRYDLPGFGSRIASVSHWSRWRPRQETS